MNVNRIVMGAIGIMIAVVMIAGAFLPAVNSAMDNERTIVNNDISNSNYSIIKDTADETHTITWDVGSTNMIVDDNMSVVVGPYNSYMVISDKIAVFVNRQTTISYMAVPNINQNFAEDVTKITVNINGSSITLTTDGAVPVNVTVSDVSWYALPDNNGTYKLAQQPNSDDGRVYYLNSLNQIYALININTNNTGVVSISDGIATLPNGTKVNMFSDAVDDERYTDLISISRYKGFYLDTEYLVNSDSSSIAPYFMLVPTKVIVHTHEQASIQAMFSVLPIIGVAGLVIAGVYVFINRK